MAKPSEIHSEICDRRIEDYFRCMRWALKTARNTHKRLNAVLGVILQAPCADRLLGFKGRCQEQTFASIGGAAAVKAGQHPATSSRINRLFRARHMFPTIRTGREKVTISVTVSRLPPQRECNAPPPPVGLQKAQRASRTPVSSLQARLGNVVQLCPKLRILGKISLPRTVLPWVPVPACWPSACRPLEACSKVLLAHLSTASRRCNSHMPS